MEVFADGFTNIIDLARDRDGNLYVLEIAGAGLLSGNLTGSLIRVADDGTRTELIPGRLFAPGGLALDDETLFVSNCSVCAGGGEVLAIDLEEIE